MGLIVGLHIMDRLFNRTWIAQALLTSYGLLNLLLYMPPTKTLRIVVTMACLGLAVMAFQLTKGVSDSESSTELQEAMPALQ